ncbi:hypothetical protein [Streptomyces kebangsaanensis]|uniref:hypothetical protein n=1 Tax=Streptomyces kebangsaanensis TaxID=864058 RepID=UPI00093FC46A|nr:hypothetical protein [Streptomyces kebangsaanensis]
MVDQRQHENRFRFTTSRHRVPTAAAPAPAKDVGQALGRSGDIRDLAVRSHGRVVLPPRPASTASAGFQPFSGGLVTAAEEVRPALMAGGAPAVP